MSQARIIILKGPNELKAEDELVRLKTHFLKKRPRGRILNLRGEELTSEKLEEIFRGRDLFTDEFRLIILRNSSGMDGVLLPKLEEFLFSLPPTITAVLMAEGGLPQDLEQKLKVLKKEERAVFYAYDLPHGRKLNDWIKEGVRRQGGKIDEEAVELLAVFAGRDLGVKKKDKKSGQFLYEELFNLRILRSEIEKLVNFRMGDLIRKEDISALVKPQESQAIFELIDAVIEGEGQKALLITQGLVGNWERLSSEDALYITSMLSAQVRDLLLARSALDEFGGRARERLEEAGRGIWSRKKSFVMFKKARQVSRPSLERMFRELFLVDQRLKTSQGEPRIVLATGISNLANLSR